jgi:hypothetical protein
MISMRTSIPLKSQPARSQTSRKSLPSSVHTSFAALAAAAVLFAAQLPSGAQTPAASAPSKPTVPAVIKPPAPTASKKAATTAAHKPVHRHKRPSAAHSLAAKAPVAPAPVTPPTPEPPHWPANDRPAEASVIWDSHGLLINAANSSLKQILNDVAAATGAKVEGLGADQRIYGAYGPGKARDVLSQLLDGCGYNVLMIGDQGEGTPRQIVLSSRGGANTQTAAANPAQPPAVEEESEADEQSDADSNPRRPGRRGPNDPGAPPRTPQQMPMDQRNNQPPPP